jgi:hypothetical protein
VASILAGLTDPCGSEPAREGVIPVAASLSDLSPATPPARCTAQAPHSACPGFAHGGHDIRVGAAEGCDLLILHLRIKIKRSQPRCTRQLLPAPPQPLRRVTFFKRQKGNRKGLLLRSALAGSGSFAAGSIRAQRLRFASLHLLPLCLAAPDGRCAPTPGSIPPLSLPTSLVDQDQKPQAS